MNEREQEFLTLKNTLGEDLPGKILFDALTVLLENRKELDTLGRQIQSESQENGIRDTERRLDVRAFMQAITRLGETISKKDIDLSEVSEWIQESAEFIRQGSTLDSRAIVRAIEGKENGDVVQAIADFRSAIFPYLEREEKEVDFSPLANSQKKGFDALALGLVQIATAMREKKYPEEMKVHGEVSVSQPSWWKPFVFDFSSIWEIRDTLKKLLEKEPQKLPMKDGRVLVDIGQILRNGGMGNPFNYDSDGNVKMTLGSDSWQEAYGKGIVSGAFHYWGYTSGNQWRIKARAKEDVTIGSISVLKGEIFWKSGDTAMETAWENKGVETHFSDYRRMI